MCLFNQRGCNANKPFSTSTFLRFLSDATKFSFLAWYWRSPSFLCHSIALFNCSFYKDDFLKILVTIVYEINLWDHVSNANFKQSLANVLWPVPLSWKLQIVVLKYTEYWLKVRCLLIFIAILKYLKFNAILFSWDRFR